MNPKTELVNRILAHLNGELSETALVQWAEDYFVELTESDDEFVDEEHVLDVLGYIGAGDTPAFPLSWAILSAFLEQLGVRVRVISEAS